MNSNFKLVFMIKIFNGLDSFFNNEIKPKYHASINFFKKSLKQPFEIYEEP